MTATLGRKPSETETSPGGALLARGPTPRPLRTFPPLITVLSGSWLNSSTPSHSPPPNHALLRRKARKGRRRRDRTHSPPPAPVLHSAPHILFDCPLVSEFRSCILKDSTVRYPFWSVKGAVSLALFLLRSNSLLLPLPAHPDPP